LTDHDLIPDENERTDHDSNVTPTSDDADTSILPIAPPTAPIPEPVVATSDEDTLIEPLRVEADDETVESSTDVPPEPAWVEYAPPISADADVDAALAAVASMSSMTNFDEKTVTAALDEMDEAFDAADDDELMDRLDEIDSAPSPAAPIPAYQPALALPPINKLRRGSLGSLVPALILIGVGAWLTITTTSGAVIDSTVLAAIAIGGAVLSLLAYWISSGRWTRGALFTSAALALIGGLLFVTAAPPALNVNLGFNLVQAYPLIIAAFGIAMLIGGVLGRPASRATFAPGIVLLAAGIVGFLVTFGVIPQAVLDSVAPLWFVPVVALVLLWLLPLVFRLRIRS